MKGILSWAVVSAAVVLSATESLAFANVTSFSKRTMTTNGWDLDGKSYDYIIVGGGTAGLVLANRLSANDGTTVAVIEAGDSGYDDNDKFVIPDGMLYDSAVNTKYDWQFHTSSQKHMNNRRASWPRGKVLGGSSAINGLYYVRPSETEVNAWSKLAGGSGRWSWNSFLSGMKKSEHFRGPVKSVESQLQLQYDSGSHGHNGPIGTTWPAVTYDPIQKFVQTAESVLGPINKDPYNGDNHGTYVALSSIDKTNWQRSFSRNGYLDPVSKRSNLHVLTGHTVTGVIFDRSGKKAQATGVHYAASSNEAVHTLHANKEVIISGGAINSPQILQLSGIGDKNHLNSLGIDVVVDLPGVGENLQDHVSASMSFKPKNKKDAGPTSVTGDTKTDSYVNSAVSYTSLGKLFQNKDSILRKIQARAKEIADSHNVSPSVQKGQRKAYEAIANTIFRSNVSPLEILGNVMFGSISIQAALQHPLSRGSIKITSKNGFDSPKINPNYFAENLDLTILREGFKLVRKLSQQSPMKDAIDYETVPGDKVQSDEDWENWIRSSAGTEYHPSSTCAMLPRQDGGVVDENLKVYGTSNLRVVDASVTPIAMSCHLESVVYGLAEIAADIILGN
ncbi:hypothetical protein MEQU1_002544 [Malassezia equina]|uniref:Glucose-methanol-choline oxidoreductase N-terminal domain-containing protein n=1 Tax=Malassezia equina TaxID=1381935 RepID=A0AAF0EDX5_9BASI|nr:hypothetical protein MEQU1_002544 [Malassezia equina]